jgi:hypothetical protein
LYFRENLQLQSETSASPQDQDSGRIAVLLGQIFVFTTARGGRTAAILASLTSSCRRHEMDPQLYFMQLLMNLPSWPANDIDAWLPDRWKQAHAARCEALEIPPLDLPS